MVTMATIATLVELKREMESAGRSPEREALHEAMRALARRDPELLTTGQAADRLGVSIPTIKRWIQRGALTGGEFGGRWRVSAESVERLVKVRDTLWEMDREGNPTPDEIARIQSRRRPRDAVDTATRRA